MRRTSAFIPFGSLLLAACSSAGGTSPSVATDPGPTQVSPEATEEARVEAFLDSMYERTAVRQSFATDRGDIVDCVDFAAEPGVRALVAQGANVDELLSRFDAFGAEKPAVNPSGCPTNTVAHIRLTRERIEAAGGLDAYRASVKHVPPPPPGTTPHVSPAANPTPGGTAPDNANYGHVYSYQGPPHISSPVTGGLASLLIGPNSIVSGSFVNSAQNHSLAQIWISGGSGSTLQTLEYGWEFDANNGGPYLFVATSMNDYQDFCEIGPFGQQTSIGTTACVPWVPNPQTFLPQKNWWLPASVSGGAQHELTVMVTQNCTGSTCNWVVSGQVDGAANSVLGYFPDSGYGSGPLSTGQGDIFEVGGEVLDESGTFSNVSMGEGTMPNSTATYGKTAYVHTFGYYAGVCFTGRGCHNPFQQANAFIYTTRSQFTYNVTAAAGSSWGDWFYYGDL